MEWSQSGPCLGTLGQANVVSNGGGERPPKAFFVVAMNLHQPLLFLGAIFHIQEIKKEPVQQLTHHTRGFWGGGGGRGGRKKKWPNVTRFQGLLKIKIARFKEYRNTLAISTHVHRRKNKLINFEIFISTNGIFLNIHYYASQYFFDLEEIIVENFNISCK
jgi:hypothetical protein